MRLGGFRGAWLAVALAIALPLLFHVARHRAPPPLYSGEGFAAFYCAGAAIRERADPYRTEPLRSCEARTGAVPGGVAEPAPLPPVSLGAFALLAALPFRTAALVWSGVLALSVATTGVLLVRLAPRVPRVAVWTALLPGLAVLNGFYGETPALVAAGLAVAAYALARGKTVGAVLGAAVAAAFEPHVGGATFLALFAVPGLRSPLAVVVVAGILISSALVGPGGLVRYLAAVLPAHAASELPANDQYSATSILYALGASPHVAIVAGDVSYAVALVAGLWFAPKLARRLIAPELLAFFPAAAVLVGGVFLHDLQLALALPLAVAVANAVPVGARVPRAFGYLGLLVGAVPEPGSTLPFVACGAAAAYAAAWSAPAADGRTAWYRTRTAFGAGGLLAYVLFATGVHALGRWTAPAASATAAAYRAVADAAPGSLAETGWTAYVRAVSHPPTAGEWLARLAAEGLLAVVLVSVLRVRRARSAA